MENFRIVLATPEMLDDIYRIERSCFSDPWSSKSIEEALKNEAVVTLAALCDNDLFGFAMVCTVADESELLNLAVDEKYRKKGFAKALTDCAEKEAVERGAEVMYLEVRETNNAALGLYRAVGFSEIGRRKKYYRYPVEDAVIMAKKLKQRSI